ARLSRSRPAVRAAPPARALRSLPVPGVRARQRLRRTRASLEHFADLFAQRTAARARAARALGGLPVVPRTGEPRVLPRVEREAHPAGRVHRQRPAERELHAAAVDLRGIHFVLRRPDARALRRRRTRRVSRAAGEDDLERAARTGPAYA